MPTRWFRRNQTLVAKAQGLRAVVRDSESGWVVEAYNEFEVSQDQFLLSFGSWHVSQSTDNLPPPTQIYGKIHATRLDHFIDFQ